MLGIQIQDCGITVLALDGTRERPRLTHFSHVPLADELLSELHRHPPSPRLNEALRNAVRHSGSRLHSCALSIPDRDLSYKELDPPVLDGALLTGNLLETELQVIAEGLPGLENVDEVIWDATPIRDNANAQMPGRLRLVAMPGSYYRNLQQLCTNAGLQLRRIEPASTALQRALPLETNERTRLAVLDLGRERMDLFSFDQAPRSRVDGLALHKNEDLPQGWALPLCDPALRAEDHAPLHAAALPLQEQAQRLLQKAQMQNSKLVLQRLWLIGSSTQAPPLLHALQQLPGLPARPYNPLLELPRASGIPLPLLERHGSSAVFALGLALQGLEASTPSGAPD